MNQSIVMIVLCVTLFSCKTKPADEQATTDTTTKLNYPFTPQYSLNWQKGDEKNALIVLNCLKKYVAGDVKGAAENLQIPQYL